MSSKQTEQLLQMARDGVIDTWVLRNAAADLDQIKKLLDERLWFIDRPLVERVQLLCEQYCEQQRLLDNHTSTLKQIAEGGPYNPHGGAGFVARAALAKP